VDGALQKADDEDLLSEKNITDAKGEF